MKNMSIYSMFITQLFEFLDDRIQFVFLGSGSKNITPEEENFDSGFSFTTTSKNVSVDSHHNHSICERR